MKSLSMPYHRIFAHSVVGAFFLPVDFHFRRSLSEILILNGVSGQDRILNIIKGIEAILSAPVAPVTMDSITPVNPEQNIVTNNVESHSDIIFDEDLEGPPPTNEEAAEVQAMLASGELVLSGIMEKSDNKKKAVLGKPIPKPISRL